MINVFAKMGQSKYITWVLNIMLLVTLACVGVVSHWHINDYEVLTVYQENYSIEKEAYKQGEQLKIRLDLCKNLDYTEQVYGRFVDGVIYALPDTASDFDVTCYDTFLTEVKIPKNLPPGTYYYEEKVIYRVNPIKTVEYTFRTPEFEVVGQLCD